MEFITSIEATSLRRLLCADSTSSPGPHLNVLQARTKATHRIELVALATCRSAPERLPLVLLSASPRPSGLAGRGEANSGSSPAWVQDPRPGRRWSMLGAPRCSLSVPFIPFG